VGRYTVSGDAVGTDSVDNKGGPIVVNADLELLFWGDFLVNAVNPSAGDVVNAVSRVLGSPYLSTLSQYGFQRLNLRGSTVVRSPGAPAPAFSADNVRSMVWDLIDSHVFPEPDDDGGRIIYMTFPPSGTTYDDSGARGAHTSAKDTDLFDVDYAWVAWVDYGDLDYITDIFSHELVETITQPEPRDDAYAWVMNRAINGGDEIGDACNNTADRLDGLLLQAYWSEQDKACVIPWHGFSAGLSWTTDTLDTTTIATDIAEADTGPCQRPAPYRWFVERHHQRWTFNASTQGLDPPVFDWKVSGQSVSGNGSLAVAIAASHPDLNGLNSADATVKIRYEQVGPILRLFNDPADGSYSVDVTLTVTDGRGAGSARSTRVLADTAVFDGQEFRWEDAYYKARQACFAYLRTIGRKAVEHHGPRTPGGDPPWVDNVTTRLTSEDRAHVRELGHLAHYLEAPDPGLAQQLRALIATYHER
jgi:hypothetical protein